MKCPECSAPDFYVGFMGGNCIRPGCTLFKNGNLSGTPVLTGKRVPAESFWIGDLVWVDRGIGWNGEPDGYLMAGQIRSVWESGDVVVALSWDNKSPSGERIPRGFEWAAKLSELIPRAA